MVNHKQTKDVRGNDQGILPYFLKLGALSGIYFLTAKFGLGFDPVSGFATLVWPPSGIALSALLLFGFELWPGIFLGAFFINFQTGAAALPAAGIAAGNTLEALLGSYLLLRFFDFHISLKRVRDVLALIIAAGALSTMAAATAGTMSLQLAGHVTEAAVGKTWLAWWLGDMLGILVVTPVLLTWGYAIREQNRQKLNLLSKKLAEGVVLIMFVSLISLVVFGNIVERFLPTVPLTYLVFLPLIWPALRFGQRAAVTAMFVITVIAVWGTTNGYGPFAFQELKTSLLLLQLFVGVISISSMVLAATVEERKTLNESVQNRQAQVEKLNAELQEKVAELLKQRKYTEDSQKALINVLESLHLAKDLALEWHGIVDGIIVTNHESKIMFMNPKAEILTKRKLKEAAGHDIHEFVEKFDGSVFHSSDNSLKGTSQISHPDGTKLSVTTTVIPISSGGSILGLLLVFEEASGRNANQI